MELGKLLDMKCRIPAVVSIILIVLLSCSFPARAERPASALAVFDTYAASVESRLTQQHRSAAGFLADVQPGSQSDERLRRSDLIIRKLSPGDKLQPRGALSHDWLGTAFVPGATAAEFENLMKDLGAYPRVFAPQVTRARIVAPQIKPVPDRFTATMRVRQMHVITVVMDTTYDVTYGRLDPQHGYSFSRSTQSDEIADAGTSNEHALSADKEHGFLWRLNTYWTYEQRDGGLYIQIESISLTRGIPPGLAWAIGPFVESFPRESLEFTLHATSKALQK
jgi:hypothetical protein